MAFTFLVETGTGSTTANSYVTVLEASDINARIPDKYNADWDATTPFEKQQVLVWATQLLDEQVEWRGVRQTQDQALQWPRHGVLDKGRFVINSGTIPLQVRSATAELARQLFIANLPAEPGNMQGLDSLTVGPISLDFSSDFEKQSRVLVRSVKDQIWPLGRIRADKRSSMELFRG